MVWAGGSEVTGFNHPVVAMLGKTAPDRGRLYVTTTADTILELKGREKGRSSLMISKDEAKGELLGEGGIYV